MIRWHRPAPPIAAPGFEDPPEAMSYDLPPHQLALLRQEALDRALSTAQAGEGSTAVLSRAEAYLAFVLTPLRADQVALNERAANRLH